MWPKTCRVARFPVRLVHPIGFALWVKMFLMFWPSRPRICARTTPRAGRPSSTATPPPKRSCKAWVWATTSCRAKAGLSWHCRRNWLWRSPPLWTPSCQPVNRPTPQSVPESQAKRKPNGLAHRAGSKPCANNVSSLAWPAGMPIKLSSKPEPPKRKHNAPSLA